MIFAALADLDVLPGIQGPTRRALLIGAIACFIAAGFAILMDIGKPERVFNMLLSPNFGSMFVWDFFALAAGVIAAAPTSTWAPRASGCPSSPPGRPGGRRR